MMDELKPCPCCGSKAIIGMYGDGFGRYGSGHGGYAIHCSNIYKCGLTQMKFDSEEEAIEAWNRRVNDES